MRNIEIAEKATRGAAWIVAGSIGGRLVGVLGTLVMTRFVRPDVIGEVSDATILVITANLAATFGIGQYAIVKGRGAATGEVTWHATLGFLVLGTIALGAVTLARGAITPLLDAPHAAVYVPGMALAFWIRRLGAIPERVLQRELRFGASALASGLGELAYTVTSLGFVIAGWGGFSIVIGNIVQSSVAVAILVSASGVASWTTPARLSASRVRDMLRFGAPLEVQGLADAGSRYWDNLLVSHFFGAGATGAYNMAYNLADIPAIQIGEQVSGVLIPSIAELPPERRAEAFERATALMSVIVFPLAVGLGLIAEPLIALILPANRWQDVAPLLAVLACLSVLRPITWTIGSYMVAVSQTRKLMMLKLVQLGMLLATMTLLAPLGLRAAAAAVGIAFGTSAIAGVVIVSRDGPSPRRLFVGFMQPLAACGVMALAVLLAGRVLAGMSAAIVLPAEIVTGAAAYIAAALVLCPATSRELIRLATKVVARRRRVESCTP